jgi:hypothetical protein
MLSVERYGERETKGDVELRRGRERHGGAVLRAATCTSHGPPANQRASSTPHPTTRRIAQEGCEDGTGIGKSPPTSTLLVAWKYRNTSLCDAYYSHSREGSKGIPPRDSCGHLLVPEVMAKNIHTYVCVKHLQIASLFREHHFSEHVSTCKRPPQQ